MLQRWTLRRGIVGGPLFDGLLGVCPVPASDGDLPQVPPPSGPGDADISFIMHSAAGAEHGTDGAFSMGGLAKLFAQLHIKTLCFAHFFSGHRRVGDLQHQIESHFIQDHTQLFCLSVDFCLQGEEGNLVTAKSRSFWTQQIKSGAIIGCGGGPPCETFTAARLLQGGPPLFVPTMSRSGCPAITSGSGARRFWARSSCSLSPRWSLSVPAMVAVPSLSIRPTQRGPGI